MAGRRGFASPPDHPASDKPDAAGDDGRVADDEPVARRSHAVAPLVVALVPLVVLGVVSIAQAGQDAVVSGDLATQALRTRSAERFDLLLGPYSRYGWSHPGPIAFYWAAPFSNLAGDRPGGMAAAAACATLVWATVIVVLSRAHLGVRGAWAAAGALVGFQLVLGAEWLRHAWNPFQVILPVAVVGVAGAAARAGSRGALVVVALAATVAVQTHIGTLPVVVALAMVTVGPLVFQERRRWRSWIRAGLATVAVLAVAWAPAIIEQLQTGTGNLRRIVDFFFDHRGEHQAIGDVVRVVLPQLTLADPRLGDHLAGGLATYPTISLALVVVAVVLFGVVVTGLVRAHRRGAVMAEALATAALAGGAASILATRAATGELLAYFTSFATGVGVLAWCSALHTLLDVAHARLAVGRPARDTTGRVEFQVLRGAGAVGALVVVAGALVAVRGTWSARSFAEQVDAPEVARLADAAQAVPGLDRGEPILVVVGRGRPWPEAAGLVAELDRRGTPIATPGPWASLFGIDVVPAADTAPTALLVTGVIGSGEARRFADPPPGARPVARVTDAQLWALDRPSAIEAGVKP